MELSDVRRGSWGQEGFDSAGCTWVEFATVPDFGLFEECVDCGAEIASGWECYERGACVCGRHVEIIK